MDFRQLFQRQLEEKNTEIDRLQQRVKALDQQVFDLNFNLVEHQSQQAATPKAGINGQLVREVQALHETNAHLKANNNELREAYTTLKDATDVTIAELERTNQKLQEQFNAFKAQQRPAAGATTATFETANQSQAFAECQALKQKVESLTNQLQVANREAAQATGCASWDRDKDDEEPDVKGLASSQRRKPPPPPPYPRPSPFAAPPTPTKSASASSIPSRPKPRTPSKTASPSTFGSNAGRRGALNSTPTSAKRKLSQQEELEQEVRDPGVPIESPSGLRKRSRFSESSNGSGASGASGFSLLPDGFEFDAVTEWQADGTRGGFPFADLKGIVPELWEKIKEVVDRWEEAKGEYWSWEFEKSGYNKASTPCVTKKMKGGRVQWRPGCEGKYACRDCVKENRPCFTRNGAEFLLLPLHEEDRVRRVQKDFEIRYWINA